MIRGHDKRITHTFSGYGESQPLRVKVAGGDVVNNAVNGTAAHHDRALPGGAEGEHQRDAQTYDQRKSADDQRAAKAGAHGRSTPAFAIKAPPLTARVIT